MGTFRLVMLLLATGLGSVAAVCFGLYVVQGEDRWMRPARLWGRRAWAAVLLWFNVEVWGRVVLIIVNWD